MNRHGLIAFTLWGLILLAGCTYPPAREHSRLGDLYFWYGKYPQAEKEYREVLRLNPRDAETHLKLGNVLERGVWVFRDSMSVNVLDREVWLFGDSMSGSEGINRGPIIKNQKVIGEVVGEYREAVRLKPDWAEAHWRLGNMLELQGNIAETEKEAQEYIRLRPWDFYTYYNYAQFLDGQDRRREARKYWEKGLRMLKRKADPKSDEVIKHRLAEPD